MAHDDIEKLAVGGSAEKLSGMHEHQGYTGSAQRNIEPIQDPWKHRSTGMVCRTCMYFVPKQDSRALPGRGALGRCRRRAPTMAGFPAVWEVDWCGDHKLDETRA